MPVLSLVYTRPHNVLRWAMGLLFLALAVATLPLPLVVGASAVAGGGLLLLRWPWLAWLGLALALPVTSGIKFGPLSLTDLALAGAVGLWFGDGVRRRRLPLDPAPLPILLGLYIVVLFFPSLRAVDLGEAVTEMVKWAEVLVAIWLVGQVMTPRRNRWLVATLLSAGTLQALLGLYQFIFRIGPPNFLLLDRFMRAAGTFKQPNPFGGYLGLTLPVAVSLAFWAWTRLPGQDENEAATQDRQQLLPWALFYSTAAGLIGLGLLSSWSRGAWLGATAGVGTVLVLRSRRALLLSLVAAVLLAAAVLLGALNPALIPAPIAARVADIPAYFGVGDVINQPITDENFSVIERLAHWLAALRMWERSPWLGVGPGNYAVVYPQVRLPLWEEPLGHAHNIYLNVLAETGLVGLAAYLLLWAGLFFWLWRNLRQVPPGSWNAALLLGVIGVGVHLSVHNVFDNLYVQGIYLHIALWLAAATVAARLRPAPKQIQ